MGKSGFDNYEASLITLRSLHHARTECEQFLSHAGIKLVDNNHKILEFGEEKALDALRRSRNYVPRTPLIGNAGALRFEMSTPEYGSSDNGCFSLTASVPAYGGSVRTSVMPDTEKLVNISFRANEGKEGIDKRLDQAFEECRGLPEGEREAEMRKKLTAIYGPDLTDKIYWPEMTDTSRDMFFAGLTQLDAGRPDNGIFQVDVAPKPVPGKAAQDVTSTVLAPYEEGQEKPDKPFENRPDRTWDPPVSDEQQPDLDYYEAALVTARSLYHAEKECRKVLSYAGIETIPDDVISSEDDGPALAWLKAFMDEHNVERWGEADPIRIRMSTPVIIHNIPFVRSFCLDMSVPARDGVVETAVMTGESNSLDDCIVVKYYTDDMASVPRLDRDDMLVFGVGQYSQEDSRHGLFFAEVHLGLDADFDSPCKLIPIEPQTGLGKERGIAASMLEAISGRDKRAGHTEKAQGRGAVGDGNRIDTSPRTPRERTDAAERPVRSGGMEH